MIQSLLFKNNIPTTTEFERFWKEYPRKVGKPRAQFLFKRIQEKEPEKLGEILEAVRLYKEDVRNRRVEDVYILHPATFLNQRRWEDETVKRESPLQKEANVQWENIMVHVKRHGRYAPPPQGLTQRAVLVLRDIGGLNMICNTSTGAIPKIKNIFIEKYVDI